MMRRVIDQTCVTNLQGTKNSQVLRWRLALAVVEQVDLGNDDLTMAAV